MTQWLAPVAAALDAAPSPCPVFFRDDDAGWDDDALVALLDRFESAGLPIDVAAIPDAVTPALGGVLRSRQHAGGVRVHQHGRAHVDHEPEGRKCEFGAARPLEEQTEDVRAGRDRLHDVLAGEIDPVFTPPWNRCTTTTADAMMAAGLRVLSRDESAGSLGCEGIMEVPVTVDWFGRTRGIRWSSDELGRRLAAGVTGGGPVGIMLHHAVTDGDELDHIGDLLGLVARHPTARPTTIMEVAES